MSTLSSYMKEALAIIKGDTAEAIAAKNERKGKSAFDSQIAALKAKLVDDESAVEDAQERLKEAYYPSHIISDAKYYVQNVVEREEALEYAKSCKKQTEDSIAKYEDTIKKIFSA